jgi:hypothetical protein
VSAVFFATTSNHPFEVGGSISSTHPHHPTKRARDKSVLGGSWIVVVVQTLAHANATHPASLIDPSSRIFKDLDASHPSERAMLCDG